MANKYMFKGYDLSSFLATAKGYDSNYSTNALITFGPSDKYAGETTKFVKKNCFGANDTIYASESAILPLQDQSHPVFINSNLDQIARKGTCPIPIRNQYNSATLAARQGSIYTYKVNNDINFITATATETENYIFYLKFTPGTGIQYSPNNSTWYTAPSSLLSTIVIIDMVGGGGGGGGGAIDTDWTDEFTSGGGGAGGNMLSVEVDLARSGVLKIVCGHGGDNGAVGWDDDAADGGAGFSTELYVGSTLLCSAYGGAAGTGGDEADGVGKGGKNVSPFVSIPFTATNSTIGKDSNNIPFIKYVGYGVGGKGGNGKESETDGGLHQGNAGSNSAFYSAHESTIFNIVLTTTGGRGGAPSLPDSAYSGVLCGGGGGGASAYGNGGYGQELGAWNGSLYPAVSEDAGLGGGGGGGLSGSYTRNDTYKTRGTVGGLGGGGGVIIYYERVNTFIPLT